jgi:hypothetical protein
VIELFASCVLSIPAVADKLPDVIPVADIVPPNIDIPDPAVNATCLALNVSKSVLDNNPVTELVALGILVVLALVILPLLSTVIVGTLVEVTVDDPYVFAVTPVFVNVPTPVTFDVPSKPALV